MCNAHAQITQIGLSLMPSLHLPHSGVLGKYHPGFGNYLQIYAPETDFYAEIGYIRFQPQAAVFSGSHEYGPYTIEYSDYTAIPLSIGYLLKKKALQKEGFIPGVFGGYWLNFYDYTYSDMFTTEEGVSGLNKVQLGLLLRYSKKIGHLHYGAEIRYSGLLPVSLGLQNSAYEGLALFGLRATYYFY